LVRCTYRKIISIFTPRPSEAATKIFLQNCVPQFCQGSVSLDNYEQIAPPHQDTNLN
jgi:hypothetical protein